MVAALLIVSGCGSTTAEQASAPNPASAASAPNVEAPTEANDAEVSPSPPQVPDGYTGPHIEEPAPVPACPAVRAKLLGHQR